MKKLQREELKNLKGGLIDGGGGCVLSGPCAFSHPDENGEPKWEMGFCGFGDCSCHGEGVTHYPNPMCKS